MGVVGSPMGTGSWPAIDHNTTVPMHPAVSPRVPSCKCPVQGSYWHMLIPYEFNSMPTPLAKVVLVGLRHSCMEKSHYTV